MLDDYFQREKRQNEDHARMARQNHEESSLRDKHSWEDRLVREQRREEDDRGAGLSLDRDHSQSLFDSMRYEETRQRRQQQDVERFSRQDHDLRLLRDDHRSEDDEVRQRRASEDGQRSLLDGKRW